MEGISLATSAIVRATRHGIAGSDLGALGLLVTATVGETDAQAAGPDRLVAEIAALQDLAAVPMIATNASVVAVIIVAAALPGEETYVMTVVAVDAMKIVATEVARMIAAAVVAMAAAETEVVGAMIAATAEETIEVDAVVAMAAVATTLRKIVESDAKTTRTVAATDKNRSTARTARKEARTTRMFAAPSRASISRTRRVRSGSMARSKIRILAAKASRDLPISILHATMAILRTSKLITLTTSQRILSQ